MKILCSKKELSLLVRGCECNIISDTCKGCLFLGLCQDSDNDIDGVEDICEVVPEG